MARDEKGYFVPTPGPDSEARKRVPLVGKRRPLAYEKPSHPDPDRPEKEGEQ
jgi:hypothetical protein